jgi:ribosomal protein S1
VIAELEEGDVVEGTVTSVKPFGAFVEIGQGVEGLVWATDTPADVAVSELEPGSPLTVRVLDIQEDQEKVALGITDPLPA